MSWKLQGRSFGENQQMLQVADLAVYNMLRQNARNEWERPIYFAVTVARSGQLNLQNYFQLEGQAYRVLPIKHNQPLGRVIPGITDDHIQKFQFTNLADSSAYYNENARRMVDGYRLHVSHTAERLAKMDHSETAQTLLDNFVAAVPFSTIPGDVQTLMYTARAYRAIGDTERLAGVLRKAQPVVFNDVRTARSRREFSRSLLFAGRIRRGLKDAGQTEALSTFDEELNALLAEAPYRVPPRIRRAYGLASDTSAASPQPPALPSGMGSPSPSSPPNGSPNK